MPHPHDESHNPTRVTVWATLYQLMTEHPSARIVTYSPAADSGVELDLYAVTYDVRANKIELSFD